MSASIPCWPALNLFTEKLGQQFEHYLWISHVKRRLLQMYLIMGKGMNAFIDWRGEGSELSVASSLMYCHWSLNMADRSLFRPLAVFQEVRDGHTNFSETFWNLFRRNVSPHLLYVDGLQHSHPLWFDCIWLPCGWLVLQGMGENLRYLHVLEW